MRLLVYVHRGFSSSVCLSAFLCVVDLFLDFMLFVVSWDFYNFVDSSSVVN